MEIEINLFALHPILFLLLLTTLNFFKNSMEFVLRLIINIRDYTSHLNNFKSFRDQHFPMLNPEFNGASNQSPAKPINFAFALPSHVAQ